MKSFASRRMASVLLMLSLWLSLFIPLMGVATIATAADDPRAATGEWGPAINWGIFGKHMALLHNGKVLAWPTGEDAFVWDPVTQAKTAVPALFGDLHCAAQTTLDDGRVLVAGGVIVSPHDGITVTAIFDPITNLWTNATPMNYPRWYVRPQHCRMDACWRHPATCPAASARIFPRSMTRWPTRGRCCLLAPSKI